MPVKPSALSLTNFRNWRGLGLKAASAVYLLSDMNLINVKSLEMKFYLKIKANRFIIAESIPNKNKLQSQLKETILLNSFKK
jgi:hypothetical protein